MKKPVNNKKLRRGGGWQSRRILSICILVSALIHVLVIFSIQPWWGAKAPRKPRWVKAISLKLQPRPARPKPPVKAPPPEEKIPEPKPIYTREELDEKLARVRAEELADTFARPRVERVKEVIQQKKQEAMEWVEREKEALEEETEQVASGEVGYSRIIDLREVSSYQVKRLMEHFKMSLGYGRRKITDFNLQFTTEWLLTTGQIRDYVYHYGGSDSRRITADLPAGSAPVSLREAGEGPPRPYIYPTIKALAAIITAEEEYLNSTGADPDSIEKLIFGPVWTFRRPAFTVIQAEERELTPAPAGGEREEIMKAKNHK